MGATLSAPEGATLGAPMGVTLSAPMGATTGARRASALRLERLVHPATAQCLVDRNERRSRLCPALRETILDGQRLAFGIQPVDEVSQASLESLPGEIRGPFACGGRLGQQ